MKNTTHLTSDIKILSEDDLINEILYLIYKLNDNPKYSTVSELIYVLGKDNLFKLCSVFGGCDLKIPTLLELKLFTGALYIHSAMNNDGYSFDDAFKALKLDSSLKKQIFTICSEIEALDEQQ